jgi:hypothetical protein
MKKEFVRFFMRNKKHDITLPFDMAETILDSKDQLIKVIIDGKWTGITINKSEIISTDHDFDKERERNYNPNQLARSAESLIKEIDLNKFKPNFLK